MPAFTIDVDIQIENLRGLKVDLEECYWAVDEATDASLRYALGVVVTQLTQRIGALEEVVRHHGNDAVTVGDLTAEETRAIERALGILDGEFVVEPTAPDGRLWARVRALLGAADELLLATARGTRSRVADHDSGPRPGVVLPLVRSGR